MNVAISGSKPTSRQGRFELSEGLAATSDEEIAHLQELISQAPGISSSQLAAKTEGRKGRVLKLLEEERVLSGFGNQVREARRFSFRRGHRLLVPFLKKGEPEPVAKCLDGSGN